jgi:hypothetical protein
MRSSAAAAPRRAEGDRAETAQRTEAPPAPDADEPELAAVAAEPS